MAKEKLFSAEAELVAVFCRLIEGEKWTPYHETSGWDLLLVHEAGYQIGIESKLSLNPKVLSQALPDNRWGDREGPDFRAVLVPADGLQQHMGEIARHLGITVISVDTCGYITPPRYSLHPRLPNPASKYDRMDWPDWLPFKRCDVPDYIPDVTGGKAAPVALTQWKIRAIKLLIVLEKRGYVTRADMKTLDISPSRWTDRYHGFLTAGERGFIRCSATPDLKAQHPTNWAQIEADFPKWGAGFDIQGPLL